MAFVVKDRVKETSTTTGTGTLTLAGAVSGFRSFADIGNSNTTAYVILESSESTPTAWEVGIGTYTSAGTTLSRDTVLRTSAGNTTKITLASGTHTVFCGFPADYGLEVWNQMNSGYTYIYNDGSTTQTPTHDSSVKISTPLTTVGSNPYTWWDTTNKKFLPTRAGNYLVGATVQMSLMADQQVHQSAIWKNGSAAFSGPAFFTSGASCWPSSPTVGVMAFNGSTDYAEVYVYYSDTVNRTTATGAGAINFWAIYLGP